MFTYSGRMMDPSPETTGLYKCPRCGNTQRFTGIDANGWGGPDSCEYDGRGLCADECQCATELTQDFDVLGEYDGKTNSNDTIEYHAFTGGTSGAEIGSYTTILCRDCEAIIWDEEGFHRDEA